MQEEMVSGPDLGAGFLYQLTRRRHGPEATFTYHAQEGGQDANGPPIGTPEPFGWVRAPAMCPFGGRTCWHRTFRTEDREVGVVRAAYNRMRFVMEATLAQAYRGTVPPWEVALADWCTRVVPSLAAASAPWELSGSAAQAIHGRPVPVGTLTFRTNPAGVRAAAASIPEYLIEPPGQTEWGAYSVVAARAFVGTLVQGTRVEWAAGPLDPSTGRESSGPRVATVQWNGHSIPVEPDP